MFKKHILLVTSEVVPFYYGGIGTQFKSLAALLRRHGHQVSLLARRPHNFNENLYRSHYGETPIFLVDTPPAYTWPPSYFVYAAEVARRFDEIYPQVRPDLVICADFNAEGLFLLLRSGSGAYEGTTFLLTTQGMNFEVISIREGSAPALSAGIMAHSEIGLLLAMEDLCVHLASEIVSPSLCTGEEIQKRLGIRKSFRIIPNLVDCNLFLPDPSRSRKERKEDMILFVGRLDRMKGTDLLLKAYFDVAAQMEPAIPKIVFIGRDCYWNEYGSTFLEYWANRIPEKYAAAISFLGQVNHNEIRDYLKRASVAVFPSRWEPFGIVCLEALSMGCPVVVSSGTGLEEVLGPSLSEFTVPVTEEVRPLAEKILSLLGQEDGGANVVQASPAQPLAERLRARALEVVQQAETAWLYLLRDIHAKKETRKSGDPPISGPLHRLLASLEDGSWRGETHLQLYFRHSGGYTETDSLRRSFPRLCWATLNIPLLEGTGESPLRLDPSDAPGTTRIKEIVLFDENEREYWRADGVNRFRGCRAAEGTDLSIEDGCLVIRSVTDDPQVFLDFPETDRSVTLHVVLHADSG